jgi:hypothetical protein
MYRYIVVPARTGTWQEGRGIVTNNLMLTKDKVKADIVDEYC